MSEPLDPEIARIAEEMERQAKSRAALGRLLGLDSSQVTRLFSGKRRLQIHEYKKALQWLRIEAPPESVAGGAIVPMPGLVPLYGLVGASPAGRFTLAEQNLRGYVPMHPNQVNVRDAFALEVADVSMSPRYEPGEVIYLAPNRFPRAGQDCVVVTDEPEGLLKRFVRRVGDEKIILHQLNPEQDLEVALIRLAAIHSVVGRG